MNLKELIEPITTLHVAGDTHIEIKGIAYDSRQVKSGWLFVAIAGTQTDGSAFISDALSNGAVAVVSETNVNLGPKTVHIRVANARRALAELATIFHGDLSHQMMVVGVTGTNGKTTTTYMIRDLLRNGGHEPGLIGTVAYEIGSHSEPAPRTTPESLDIHQLLLQMKTHGCDSVVMEVSSHAIALDRIHGLDFDVAVFTNLTQDHLDFHEDMDSYFNVKANLFQLLEKGAGRSVVINIDDPWGRKLVEERGLEVEIVTYGFGLQAQVRATKIDLDIHGTSFVVESPWGASRVHLQLLGRFNVHNALAALAAGGMCGIEFRSMVRSLEKIESIPGRLQLVHNRKGRNVFVDYAHTDDALKNVLGTLREICKGRLIVVFGCGGNRDRGKRPLMGRVACELADHVIVTSDNSRREDPAAIAADVVAGCQGGAEYEIVLDRRKAIQAGIAMMRRKDVLLIAGKGHETYQEFNGSIVPFDDREVVREIFR